MARRASPRFEKDDVTKDKEAELQRLEHRLVHGGTDGEASEVQVAGSGAVVDVQAEEAASSGGELLVAA